MMDPNREKRKIKVGIIGCGGISTAHIKRLRSLPQIELSGFADTNRKAALSLKEEFIGKNKDDSLVFTDYKEMIERCHLDAVGIFTPHTLHFSQCLYSLEKGLHVLVEKPMTTEVSHAEKLINKAKEKNKVLLVAYQRHYQPIFLYAKKVIEEGKLGEIKFISASLAQEWRSLSDNTWRQNPQLSGGGQLMDSGSHLIDITLWLTELEPKEVFAFVDKQELKVDIFSSFSIKFKNGALASIAISGDAPGWYENLSIWGSEGALFFQEGKVYHQLSNGDIYQPSHLPSSSDPDTNFIRAILGKEKVHSPGECGLKVIRLTKAIYKSGRKGQKVAL